MGLLYRIIGDFFSYIGDIGDTIMAAIMRSVAKLEQVKLELNSGKCHQMHVGKDNKVNHRYFPM